jgi:hypothetical protein
MQMMERKGGEKEKKRFYYLPSVLSFPLSFTLFLLQCPDAHNCLLVSEWTEAASY